MLFLSFLVNAFNNALIEHLKPFQISCQVFNPSGDMVGKFDRMEISRVGSTFSFSELPTQPNVLTKWTFLSYTSKTLFKKEEKMLILMHEPSTSQIRSYSKFKISINRFTGNIDSFDKKCPAPPSVRGSNRVTCQPLEFDKDFKNPLEETEETEENAPMGHPHTPYSGLLTSQERKHLVVLGLPMVRDLNAVKKRYRELILTHHPDKTTDVSKRAKFLEFKDAYEYLSEQWDAEAN